MAEELGYIPVKGNLDKDKYNTASKDKNNAHRKSKKRQDGGMQKDSVNAGDHLFNADGEVNPDPEQYC